MNTLGPLADPEMLRRLLDDGMVLFAAVEGDATISWMGQSSLPLLGRPAADLVGTSALDLIHPDDQEVLLSSLAESARGSDERILAVVRVGRADGTWITLEFGGIDLRDGHGAGTFVVWGRNHESAKRLFDFLGSLLGAGDLGHLLGEVVQWCDALMPFSESVVLARADDGTYRTAMATTTLPQPLGDGLVVDEETVGPWQRALSELVPIDADIGELSAVLASAATEGAIHAGWIIAVPGLDGASPDGLLVTWRTRSGRMLVTHRRHLQAAAQLCQLAFAWTRTHSGLVTAATTDSLTGLANRSHLRDLVTEHRSRPAALLFCDLDRFKDLNDQWGHAVGDRVLQQVATRMADGVRTGDLLVRLGGDEFVAWCPDLRNPADADLVAQRILDAFSRPFDVAGAEHVVGCSIGIAIAEPAAGHHVDLDQLLHQADQALYQAKGAGGGQVAHYR